MASDAAASDLTTPPTPAPRVGLRAVIGLRLAQGFCFRDRGTGRREIGVLRRRRALHRQRHPDQCGRLAHDDDGMQDHAQEVGAVREDGGRVDEVEREMVDRRRGGRGKDRSPVAESGKDRERGEIVHMEIDLQAHAGRLVKHERNHHDESDRREQASRRRKRRPPPCERDDACRRQRQHKGPKRVSGREAEGENRRRMEPEEADDDFRGRPAQAIERGFHSQRLPEDQRRSDGRTRRMHASNASASRRTSTPWCARRSRVSASAATTTTFDQPPGDRIAAPADAAAAKLRSADQPGGKTAATGASPWAGQNRRTASANALAITKNAVWI
jgi:hypothetical protein